MSRLVTLRDVEACPERVLDLPAGALVTPAAKERARARGIELRWQPSSPSNAPSSSCGCEGTSSGGCACSAKPTSCRSCASTPSKEIRSGVVGSGWRELPRLSKVKREVFRSLVAPTSSSAATRPASTVNLGIGMAVSLEIGAGFAAVMQLFVDLDGAGIALRSWSGRVGPRGTSMVDLVIDSAASRNGWERRWEGLCARYGALA